MATEGWNFGPFRYSAAQALLFDDGKPIPLGGRAARLLTLLLQRRGEVVTKGDLIEAAWPEQAVEDSNLSVQIAQLRKLIGAGWIRTVERVGYQFLPEASGNRSGSAPELSVPAFAPGNEASQEVRAELLALLGGYNPLALTTAETENARYVLRGAVRPTPRGRRISVHLVESAGGRVLWGRVAESDPAGIGLLIEQLSSMIEAEIGHAEIVRLDRRPSEWESPYDLHVKARALGLTGRSEENAIAIRLLEKAVAAEPENPTFLAAALDALAGQRIPLGWAPTSEDDSARAYAYGMRGLALDRADAGERSLFGIAIFRTGDPDLGYWVCRAAAARNPNSPLALVGAGNVTRNWGNADESRAYFHRAIELNPNGPMLRFAYGGLAALDSAAGRFEDALVWARRGLAVNPNHAAAYWHLVTAHARLGRLDIARTYLDRLKTLHPSTTIKRIEAGQPTRNGHLRNTLEGLAQAGLD